MIFADNTALILLAALALDAVFGDPDWLWRRAPHPVVLIGRLIGWLDRQFNQGTDATFNRIVGAVSLLFVTLTAAGIGILIHRLGGIHPAFLAVEIVAVAVLLAQRSLYDHVRAVFDAFNAGGLPAARQAVSLIVGRDPDALDEAGVSRAAIETTAENFSDGVVAPALYYLIFGLPGILAYKAVNTADSMIGHRTPRHEAFGWAAARLDDLLNLMPARLSGLLVVVGAALTGSNARAAWDAMKRDAKNHRSPNAGWPEAAMAGALGVALAGPRLYASGPVEDAWMNEGGRRDAQPADILKSASAVRCCLFRSGGTLLGLIAHGAHLTRAGNLQYAVCVKMSFQVIC